MVESTIFEKALDLELKRERSLGLALTNSLGFGGLRKLGLGEANHQKKPYPPKKHEK